MSYQFAIGPIEERESRALGEQMQHSIAAVCGLGCWGEEEGLAISAGLDSETGVHVSEVLSLFFHGDLYDSILGN